MEELRDSRGLTEAEFLARYDMAAFDRPSLTADNLIFSFEQGTVRLLLIRRKGHPYLGKRALPGGFVERGESAEQAAMRELAEETSLTGLQAQPCGFFSAPGRDPRGWVVTRSFLADVSGREDLVAAGDDAADARFFTVSAVKKEKVICLTLENGGEKLTAEVAYASSVGPGGRHWALQQLAADGLAFDHGAIIADALLRLEEGGSFVFGCL